MVNGSHIVHVISEGCKRAGVALNAMYRKSGLHLAQHYKWMHGKARPHADSIAKLQRGMLQSAAALVATSRELELAVANENRAAALSVLDDPFHGCALFAYMEVWSETGQFPPDSETVRERAYRYYEIENARAKAGEQPTEEDA